MQSRLGTLVAWMEAVAVETVVWTETLCQRRGLQHLRCIECDA